jgi:hypothetical protein
VVLVQKREEGVANKNIEARVASEEDAECETCRFQERYRGLDANAPAPMVADRQVAMDQAKRWQLNVRCSAFPIILTSSVWAASPSRMPTSRFVVKMVATEGVHQADLTEMVHEIRINDLSDPEIVAIWVGVGLSYELGEARRGVDRTLPSLSWLRGGWRRAA